MLEVFENYLRGWVAISDKELQIIQEEVQRKIYASGNLFCMTEKYGRLTVLLPQATSGFIGLTKITEIVINRQFFD